MSETAFHSGAEESPTPGDLVSAIDAMVSRQYPGYVRGDKLVRDYGEDEELSGRCELTHEPGGITKIVRTSGSERQVGILPPNAPPGRWSLNEDGVGVPDGTPEDATAWVTDQLTAFSRPGTLWVIPAKSRTAA